MRKLSQKDLKRFAEAKSEIEAAKSKVEAILNEAKSEIEDIVNNANTLRDEIYGAFDDLVNEAQSYYDEKSEKWQEGDNGQQYQNWIQKLEEIRDEIGDDISVDLDESVDLEAFDNIANSLSDENIPEAPDGM